MPAFDPRIDAYIEKAAPFAQPILLHMRDLVHEVCPEVEETLKWGMPSFVYGGAIMCGMAAFKKHCTFGFWKYAIMNDPTGVLKDQEATAMGSFGKMTSMDDLPKDKILKTLIREAMRLNEEGIKLPSASRKKSVVKPAIAEPEYLLAALKKNPAASAAWQKFAPSHRREYLEWLTEAKTDATREKRLATTLEWLTEGKQRHWKYQK